jgi:hypothetical protein
MKENTAQIDRNWLDDPNWLEKTGGDALDMTLRDHFAGLAMQALIATNESTPQGSWPIYVERTAYLVADAMLKERNK